MHKKGDKSDVNNYRGITRVSCFGKLFTTVLNKRINDWCENNNILSDSEFGFRKGRSTVDATFILHGIVEKILGENKRIYAGFVDLRKAFDSTNRNALWLKLYNLDISGKMLRIIRSMYTIVKSSVKHCGQFSELMDMII